MQRSGGECEVTFGAAMSILEPLAGLEALMPAATSDVTPTEVPPNSSLGLSRRAKLRLALTARFGRKTLG
jgi:hypothetical protein